MDRAVQQHIDTACARLQAVLDLCPLAGRRQPRVAWSPSDPRNHSSHGASSISHAWAPMLVAPLRAARGLQDCLQFCIQFPPDLRDALIAELSKERRRKVVLEDRPSRLVFVKHDAQRCIESGR